MSLLLDMKTIFITLVVGHLFTVILLSAYLRHHPVDATLNIFFLAKISQALAWLLLTLRGGIPDIFTVSIANTLLFIGCSLEAIALLKLINQYNKRTKSLYIGLTLFVIVGFHFVILFFNTENNRIAFASLGTGALIILPTLQLLMKKSSSNLMRIMGCLYTLAIISFVSRGLFALTTNQTWGLFTPGFIQTISFLALYLIMILGNTGFILMLKEQMDEELIYMAQYDELTNVLNRRTFITRAEQYLKECIKGKKTITFVLFDVDNFKKYNDIYGHVVGDHILMDLSERIKTFLGSEHLFGRYGGDEFAILIRGMNSNESLTYLDKMMERVTEENNTDVPKYTISIGAVTVFPDTNTELDSLYINSDKALYQAKNNGRNCIYSGTYEQNTDDIA